MLRRVTNRSEGKLTEVLLDTDGAELPGFRHRRAPQWRSPSTARGPSRVTNHISLRHLHGTTRYRPSHSRKSGHQVISQVDFGAPEFQWAWRKEVALQKYAAAIEQHLITVSNLLPMI